MGFYERQLDQQNGKIPVAGLISTLQEFSRGALTSAQVQTILTYLSGFSFSTTEQQELTDLLGTVSGGGTAKLARSQEIYDVLQEAEFKSPGYDNVTALRTRLGVPARLMLRAETPGERIDKVAFKESLGEEFNQALLKQFERIANDPARFTGEVA
jgi:hypothetical protein